MHSRTSGRQKTARRPLSEEGIALIVTLMVLMLVSALMVAFVSAVVADQRASGLDRDQTQAYAAAHAGLEQLTSDLSTLFTADFSPSATQINTLTAAPPTLTGFQFIDPDGQSGYRIGFTPDANGNPAPEDVNGSTISAGPYQGFRGIITPYNITVTARSGGGAEVRMRRTLQTVAVPVFQFGMFSENDLSFFAGANFDFGGRIHTNSNLYLAAKGSTLTIRDRVTAVGEIIRTRLVNGTDATLNYTGTVSMLKASPATFRNLTQNPNEGSLKTNFVDPNEPLWTSLSVGTYSSNIRNGRTGARRLDLPLVSQGARPIDILRRQPVTVPPESNLVAQQRFFNQAAIRILLSDTAAEITNLPSVTAAAPISLAAGTYRNGQVAISGATLLGLTPLNAVPSATTVYKVPANTPLLQGFIKIEQRTNAAPTVWNDITAQILSYGITGRNLAAIAPAVPAGWSVAPPVGTAPPCAEPDTDAANPNGRAIIRLQRVRDVPANNAPCGLDAAGNLVAANAGSNYWPLALYDSREGNLRDNGPNNGANNMTLGGVMQYVELDISNLRRWIAGAGPYAAGTGPQTRNDNGYIIYFSDRRGNKTAMVGGVETGEYGFEDNVNPGVADGTPNNQLDAGEDLNTPPNGAVVFDNYGRFGAVIAGAVAPYVGGDATVAGSTRPWNWFDGSQCSTSANVNAALPCDAPKIPVGRLIPRANPQIFFRRALKIINGGQNQLPAAGLTIAAENPVYVQGSYNSTDNAPPVTEAHAASAILADAVTLLSSAWNDIRSFNSPNVIAGRAARTTGYRMAVVAGKTVAFPHPNWSNVEDFGTDGGAHNFLRYLEDWGGQTINYRGSIVSLYTSRQATGIYKCCTTVYGVPTRGFVFDSDFLLPLLLPPGTPMFRDVNTLTFRQLLRPTQ